MRKSKLKSGFNLSEIMIAILIIAVAFLPTIGLFGTSIWATSKDDSVIRAMNLCQEKLDTALKFPFSFYDANLGVDLTDSKLVNETLSLDLNEEETKNVKYRCVLRVEDRPGTFAVREKNLDVGDNNPNTWAFKAESNVAYSKIFHRYIMTVYWKSQKDNTERFYRLVTFRADLRSFQEG